MDVLKCCNLSKTYGKGQAMVKALDRVNLTVSKGDFVIIVGPSGSGKSTLLHMIGGIDQPTEGTVHIEGIDLAKLGPEPMAIFRRRKIGIVYQFDNLVPTLDIHKNILLPILLDKRKPDMDYFNEVVSTLGLTERLPHLPGQLSGGQQQCAAIARALVYRPSIVLADEPTGNLDRKSSKDVVELFKLANRIFHQTVILITHDERIAQEANRVITIEDGKIISECRVA